MRYKVIPVTSFHQNCSLVWCEEKNEAIVIDPGGEIELLLPIITSLSLVVKKILLTHGHVDHVAGAKELSDYYKVPIVGPHFADRWLLNNIEIQCCMLNFNIVPPVVPDFWLLDHEIVMVGNVQFEVLHCPGHSPGHLIFWDKKSRFIFMGDVLFNGSIGRTDLPGGNMSDLIHSIKKVISLGDDILFLPGHGPKSTLGHERIYNNCIQHFI
ncbi:MBL fold metallo-hydrolase [Blochmannia endosymbiont of Polyrhachis (Hedomyrma) turneri]|uniref:MBL fold metallo-hydrolase n=1 Tax=Blochmannia endosymbiont of Polyrhachis (Hedomyrma) turneri TaxID=1505596 RepID=UPI00061A8B71|nr:MBL fold metallo-hydrolase [Blochmannia endosymbiont of Polyrhachis (Hedomyrma) turneri]AKC59984.1 Uncharacterized protein ycbL [Blochmannia endosymbiont of Polyrhachis (Hedomyrma) turneri]